jgi:hypothetical protein
MTLQPGIPMIRGHEDKSSFCFVRESFFGASEAESPQSGEGVLLETHGRISATFRTSTVLSREGAGLGGCRGRGWSRS